jgi:hypothetical protein
MTSINRLLNKIVRIVASAQPSTSFRSLFKPLEILSFPCQYILSLMDFIVNNQENFQTDSSIHSINTRNKHHLWLANKKGFDVAQYWAKNL